VNCSKTDAAGNTGYGSFTVTVRDTTAPVITAPGNVVAEATGPLTVVDPGSASATDAVGPITYEDDAPASYPVGVTHDHLEGDRWRGQHGIGDQHGSRSMTLLRQASTTTSTR
jgi:hypothetical protein